MADFEFFINPDSLKLVPGGGDFMALEVLRRPPAAFVGVTWSKAPQGVSFVPLLPPLSHPVGAEGVWAETGAFFFGPGHSGQLVEVRAAPNAQPFDGDVTFEAFGIDDDAVRRGMDEVGYLPWLHHGPDVVTRTLHVEIPKPQPALTWALNAPRMLVIDSGTNLSVALYAVVSGGTCASPSGFLSVGGLPHGVSWTAGWDAANMRWNVMFSASRVVLNATATIMFTATLKCGGYSLGTKVAYATMIVRNVGP